MIESPLRRKRRTVLHFSNGYIFMLAVESRVQRWTTAQAEKVYRVRIHVVHYGIYEEFKEYQCTHPQSKVIRTIKEKENFTPGKECIIIGKSVF